MQQFKNRLFAGAAAAALLLGGLGTTAFIATAQTPPPPQQATVDEAGVDEAGDGDTVQEPSYTGSIQVDESAPLPGQATISESDAAAAALAANPGSKVTASALEDENGSLVYAVQLDSGVEIKVDAGSGAVLATEQMDAGESSAGIEVNSAGEADENGGSEVPDAQETESGAAAEVND